MGQMVDMWVMLHIRLTSDVQTHMLQVWVTQHVHVIYIVKKNNQMTPEADLHKLIWNIFKIPPLNSELTVWDETHELTLCLEGG